MIQKDLKKFINQALLEDIGDGDHTSLACINKNEVNSARIISKENGIIAGIKLAEIILKEVDGNIEIKSEKKDGDPIKKDEAILTINGNAQSILQCERFVLNCMQRMSAIATKTNRMQKLIRNTHCKILDTRKTTPLNRHIEKWAVKIGGGENHRFGLYDMIMIKDNHIDFAGGIEKAINRTIKYLKRHNKNLKIIIEARNLRELKEIIKIGKIDRILLDNFDIMETKKAVNLIKNKFEVESSGGINENTVRDYANCGVDFISIGSIIHTVKNFDLSLKAL